MTQSDPNNELRRRAETDRMTVPGGHTMDKTFTITARPIDPKPNTCEMMLVDGDTPRSVLGHCEDDATTVVRATASDGTYIYEYSSCDRCLGFLIRELTAEAERYEKGEVPA